MISDSDEYNRNYWWGHSLFEDGKTFQVKKCQYIFLNSSWLSEFGDPVTFPKEPCVKLSHPHDSGLASEIFTFHPATGGCHIIFFSVFPNTLICIHFHPQSKSNLEKIR